MLDKRELICQSVTVQNALMKYANIYTTKSRICCPIHHGKHDNFQIYDDTKSFYCFTCKAAGDVIKLVSLLCGISYSEAMKQIDFDFNLGLYKKPVLGTYRKKEKVVSEAIKKYTEREEKEREIMNRYHAIISEWIRLDKNKILHKPRDINCAPDAEFIEYLQKISYQTYLLDCVESELWVFENG